ncbi:unnamed protein product, partial [Polarella glacialis]
GLLGGSRISKICLRGNGITSAGAKYLAKALNANCPVNRVRDDGVRHIFEALLKNNTQLVELDLGCNSIRDDSLDWVMEAFLHNTTLQKLSFQDNYWTDVCMKEFLRMLSASHELNLDS